jgi:hypothetical protein
VGLIWGVQGGRGSPEQGVPQWRKPTGGVRRWWRGGAAEGAGKVVEGAHGVGAEVRRGARATVCGGSTMANTVAQLRRRRKKGVAPQGGVGWCSFYSHQRQLAMAARVAAGGGNEAVGVAERLPLWSEGSRRGQAPLFGQGG